MEDKKYIYALDLSLTSSGYTIADHDFNIIQIGTIRPNQNERIDQRLEYIWIEFHNLMKLYPPSVAVIERTFTKFNTATQQLFRVHGIVNLAFKGIAQLYYSPSTIKKSVTGIGRATKPEVMKKIKEIYPDVQLDNDDESDSLAIMHHYKKIVNIGVNNLHGTNKIDNNN